MSQDIEKLKDDLLLGPGSKTLAILVASNEETLLDIYCIHFLFRSISTVLILPDHDECFQALSYRMKPNFLFYADSKEEDIVSVIAGMTGRILHSLFTWTISSPWPQSALVKAIV